jgi:hypothetical protein
MKKSITGVLTLLAGACAVHAQGTVNFGNYTTAATYIYVSYKATGVPLGGSANGPTPSLLNYAAEVGNGNDWTVELYAAPGTSTPAAALLPTGTTATFANGGIDPLAGTWYSSAIASIPGTGLAGQPATIELVAWYNEGGAITSYVTALADGVPTGVSVTENISVGGTAPSGPPVTPPTLPAFPAFTVAVPEPSTVALGVMGASAFLMRLRRKQ